MKEEDCWGNDDDEEECYEAATMYVCEGDDWYYWEDDYGWYYSEWDENSLWEEWEDDCSYTQYSEEWGDDWS